jgi:hypothetical protein
MKITSQGGSDGTVAVAAAMPFCLSPTPILDGETAVMGYFRVPTGKSLVARAAGVSLEGGAAATGVKCQVYNETDGEEVCAADGVASEAFSTGNTLAAGKLASFRLVNGSGAMVVASGFVMTSLVDA